MIGSPIRELPAPPSTTDESRPTWRTALANNKTEIGVALVGFALLCLLVLTKATQMLEPDDYAYRASITALSQGHLLLTTAQYDALSKQLGGIEQWVHLADGKWISEKNPGYPFFAVIFQMLGILRLAPLFYGGVACVGLYAGARRWIGRWGGTFAVLLYCTSGAAITFAWRDTMPSFTDASLIAAGAGSLLWAMLATEASQRRRMLVGLFAFACFDGATFIRYTDIVELGVAAAAALLLSHRAQLGWQTLASWMGMVAALGALVLGFNTIVYGAPLKTGYRSGEITFSFGAIIPNLGDMPMRLLGAMPMVAAALVAVGWIAYRLVTRKRNSQGLEQPRRVTDATVGLVLLGGWAGIWALYSAYNWTVGQGGGGGNPVHVIRFYLPAMGLIALLGAWALVKLPGSISLSMLAAVIVLGVLSFHNMASGAVGGAAGFGAGGFSRSGAGGVPAVRAGAGAPLGSP